MTHGKGPAILNSFVAADVLTTTTPVTTTILTTTTDSNHVPTPADAILKNPLDTDTADPQDITSEIEPPTPALHRPTNEELRVARAEKRAAKRAEKHTNAEDLKKQGDVLFSAEQYQEAYIPYLEATQVWPSNPTYWILLCTTYVKLGWYEEAAHSATRALTLDPKSSEARYLRGVARLEQKLLNAAKTDFETVLAHAPTHLPSQTSLSRTVAAITSSRTLGSHVLAPSIVDDVTKDLDFGYPHYPTDEDHALDVLDNDDGYSDSSDCVHVGSTTMQGACAEQSAPSLMPQMKEASETNCMFLPSSTRLYELTLCERRGKNVCTYFLLSLCKFGAHQCVYSHSTAYLPKKGWWTTEEKKDKIKAVMAIAEERKRVQRELEWQMRELERERRAKGKASAKKDGAKDKAKAQAQAPKDNVDTATGTLQKKKSTVRRGKGKAKIKAKSTAVIVPDDKAAPEVKADNDAPSVPFTDYNLASPVVPRPDALEAQVVLLISSEKFYA
ncbi:uncharacterized protein LACBIDRAFT_295390 [Laccaria bicolor S238N-H82]|uniref:Predicted protein n=1 Tax=Laccaria bicolor (strain S238N-H82 / ATCC MYA-4686) TaxID=486041 RepID=B0DS25_LACBS|nr:uncharacterized protein LACBIDRAFT_295390 [Laccaria bicolor S238N-H82]EDR02625.1 predicted protein [Laccaria bicolor S238N-H82]|eukprot:XP_001886669.1 predicted protein [Laccaria bicolor S238N-H82]